MSKQFEGTNLIMNVLFLCLAVSLLLTVLMLVVLCRNLLVTRCFKPVVSLIHTIERKLMYNSFLRAALETYL